MLCLRDIAVAALLTSASASLTPESEASNEISLADFEPLEAPTVAFFDQFIDGSNWKASLAKKDDEFAYVGKWEFEEASYQPTFKGDKGLVLKSEAAHHAISALLPQTFDNTNHTLVLQYEVKFQKGLACGGAYIKLLSENEDLHSNEFSGETDYQVMFGPDKCGSTNKVHFIIRRKSPITGEYEEKHLAAPPSVKQNKYTNLYTLIIHPNQDFEIRINGVTSKAGSLLTEGVLKPGLNPSAQIEDVNDKKPEDWVDELFIPDPENSVKPADWDEDAPFFIVDTSVVKPTDWDETIPLYIPDPESTKPVDWDDEEDGEFVAPEIFNPECESHGCGEWRAPKIKNPNYVGEWVAPMIENPAYAGEWASRLVDNPVYYEDLSPSNLEPIGGLGLELWTMQADILFDNIYLGHSVEEAEMIGNSTFVVKRHFEETAYPKKTEAPKRPVKDEQQKSIFTSGITGYDYAEIWETRVKKPARYYLAHYRRITALLMKDPLAQFTAEPVLSFFCLIGFFSSFAVTFGLLGVVSFLASKFFTRAPKHPFNLEEFKTEAKAIRDTQEIKSTEVEVVEADVDKSAKTTSTEPNNLTHRSNRE
ncbi:calnexin [Nadsonia fulvescens var. elongata DSM 6958]|uniref:Calnexin n=1 Tax=Nadsonia fulvescens var. elongata DSM 6958 TaxID=857566 RepID=A0A1E3PK87_9ASCO|nr:calnexin [Nadsonia fulvescens var. elongata DSM 6958]